MATVEPSGSLDVIRYESRRQALKIDGYNFALNRMRHILSKYPLRSESYLMTAQPPDLHEYVVWKRISARAMLNRLDAQQALSAFEEEVRAERNGSITANGTVSPMLTQASTIVKADSPALGAAQVLASMSFQSMVSNGRLVVDDDSPASLQSVRGSPKFPRTDDLPLPKGEDAFLLNPILEDAQRRWVKGHYKEDQQRVSIKRDADGNRVWSRKTVYIVDGKEFDDFESKRKRKALPMFKHCAPRSNIMYSGMDASAILVAPRESQPRIRPLDSGISLDTPFELQSRKRTRSASIDSDDAPVSSMSRPGAGQSIATTARPAPTILKIPSRKLEPRPKPLPPKTPTKPIDSFMSFASDIPDTTMRPQPGEHIVRTSYVLPVPPKSGSSQGSRRKGPPAPLNLVPIPRPKRLRDPSSSSPSPQKMMFSTPQHSRSGGLKAAPPTPSRSSPADSTPRKNKYVPTTPNPLRWTPTELYYLNELARKGLHPKDLHPLMTQQFPDRVRSVHAIKDRRDKMARAKELIGKVPDYEARYGNIEE